MARLAQSVKPQTFNLRIAGSSRSSGDSQFYINIFPVLIFTFFLLNTLTVRYIFFRVIVVCPVSSVGSASDF